MATMHSEGAVSGPHRGASYDLPAHPVAVVRGPVVLRWELFEVVALLAAGHDQASVARHVRLTKAGVYHRMGLLWRALDCPHTAAAAVARAYDLGFLPAVGFA